MGAAAACRLYAGKKPLLRRHRLQYGLHFPFIPVPLAWSAAVGGRQHPELFARGRWQLRPSAVRRSIAVDA